MKKCFALLLVLALCLMSLPGLAEDAAATQTYTHPTQGYSISVPASWLCVDQTNVQDLIAAFQNGELSFSGTDAATLESQAPQLEATNCAIMISEHANNMVLVQENMGIELTKEQFVALMIPMLQQQLRAQFPTIQFNETAEVQTFGENEFIIMPASYQIYGLDVSVDMLFYLDGSTLYTISMTVMPLFGQDVKDAFYANVLEACATFAIAK